MRLLSILVILAAAGAATAQDAPDVPLGDSLDLDLPVLGTTRVGLDPLRNSEEAVESAATQPTGAPPAPPQPWRPTPHRDEPYASHDARDEPAPEDGPLRDELPAFVSPVLDEVAPVVDTVAEDVGFLDSVANLFRDTLTLLAPEAGPAGPAAAVRDGAAAGGEAVRDAAVGAAVAAAPAAGMLAGAAATALPGTTVASDAWRRLRHLLVGVAGYTRLTRARLLDQEARNAIHAAVRGNPGVTTPNLAKVAAVGRTTATYHLRVLEREGYVASRIVGRSRHWFPVGEARALPPEALALLQHPTTGKVAEVVKSAPGIDQTTLCTQLGLSPSLAHWHLDRLAAAGLVTKARDGRRVRYHPVA